MNDLLHTSLFLIVLCNFYMLSTGRLANLIRILSMEGALMALLPAPAALAGSAHAIILVVGTLAAKSIVMPTFLMRTVRSIDEPPESQPIVGFVYSLILGFIILALAFVAGLYVPLGPGAGSRLHGAVGLSTLLTGMLFMVNSRKAISQVIGFLIMENGILILAVGISQGLPFVIEIAVLFDILLAAMIFGGFIHRMHDVFMHTDVSRMHKLKG